MRSRLPRVRDGLRWVVLAATAAWSAPMTAAAPADAASRFARASVVPSRSGDSRSGVRFDPDGRWTATNMTIRELIALAYQRHGFDRREVSGGPEWIDSERFDVETKTDAHVFAADGSPRQTWLMLRAFLAERFQLKVRGEMRERPVHELVMARDDRRLGPRLRRSDTDCGAVMKRMIAGERPGKPECSFAPYPGRLVATAVTIPDFASVLSSSVDRPVVDRTGLEGNFDLEVEGVEIRPDGPVGPSNRPSDTTRSIFTTLPEQLGLKLQPREGRVEVIVVEAVEKPRLERRPAAQGEAPMLAQHVTPPPSLRVSLRLSRT
jgi:uncharacterized protein (TIGR03435 family)